MGKNNKKRKRTEMLREASIKFNFRQQESKNQRQNKESFVKDRAVASLDESNSSSSDDDDSTKISDTDLAITLKTLQKVAGHPPELFLQSKVYKPLRKVLHPFVLLQMQSYEKVDYSARVTSALLQKKWTDALLNLQACQDFQIAPKQGTVQRWVRDVTATSNGCNEDHKLKLLLAILQLDGNNDNSKNNNKHDPGLAIADEMKKDGTLLVLPAWRIPNEKDESGDDEMDSIGDPISSNYTANLAQVESKIIYREKAQDRTPPNKYDLLLHLTAPNTIVWDKRTDSSAIKKHVVDFLPNSAFLQNVLTSQECQQIVDIATTLGFRKDHPIAMKDSTGIDSCEWFVDESIRNVVYQRVQRFLPMHVTNGEGTTIAKLDSINPRWRLFRYGQDSVYRPHIDGSWPESRLNSSTGDYECDESGATRSYYTFLIYLNQGFEGGETKYYFVKDANRMACQGITPLQGSVLVFPQANTASLIHEGSMVTKGIKYVVRTDVLYQLVGK